MPVDAGSVVLRWDAYRGAAADKIEYRVYRSARAAFTPDETNRIGNAGRDDSWTDHAPLAGKGYYRVVACQGDRPVGRSWLASIELPARRR
jgi:hypothetical protein